MRRLAILALASCLAAGSAAAQQDTLRIRLNSDVRSLDPGTNRDGNTDAIQTHLFEGLVAFKEDGTVGPLLAKSVEVSPDGTKYRFVLREGLRFSSGEPLTAADVLFAWKRYTDPATGWRCLSEVDGRGALKVTDVAAEGTDTVVFTLAKPSALFLTTLARPDCGGTGIFHRSSLGPDGKWRAPVTTAPFKLGEWVRAQHIDLVRNEHYAPLPGLRDGLTGNKTVSVAKVRYVIIADDSTSKAALVSGSIDINPDIASSDVEELKKNRDLVLDSAPTLGINDFLFQTKDPLVSDVRIRRAFLLSLDLPLLVEQITDGQTVPNNSPIPTASPYRREAQAAVVGRDLPTARKLLAEAGYKGQAIRMLTNRRYQSMFDQAVMAQAMARDAGINIELDVVDWGAQQDRYLSGDYQMMSHSFSSRLDPSLSFEMFLGDKAKQPRKVWDNPGAIALLAESMRAADVAARQKILDEMEALFRTDVAMIVLYSEVRTSAVRANVVGYKSWPLGSARAWGVSLRK